MNILITGHACSPNLGSEPGFTWNHAWRLAADNAVWVIAHPQYRADVDRALMERPRPNLQFIWADVPAAWNPWDPARGERWIRLHYLLWQRAALRIATRLISEVHFDISHHVSWGSINAPPLLWKLPIPFVWGPVGGGQTSPLPFRKYYGSAWPAEALRNLRVQMLRFNPAFRRAARASALSFATNRETASVLRSAGAAEVKLCLDCSIAPDTVEPPPRRRDHGELHLLWAGRLERRKGLPVVLEALAQCRESRARLTVAGDGPMRAEWEALAHRLDLGGRVTFLGHQSWTRMPELFRSADAFVFSSLRDSFGSVVLEAMSHALPVIALDHQGVGCFVPDDAGLKAPVTTPAETVSALASAIARIAANPERRRAMSRAAWRFAQEHTWDRRITTLQSIYREVLHAHRDLRLQNQTH